MNRIRALLREIDASSGEFPVSEDIALLNARRTYYWAVVAVPVHLAHVVVFLLSSPGDTDNTRNWRIGIILAHATMLLLVLAMGAAFHLLRHRGKSASRDAAAIPGAAGLAYLLFGAAVCAIDQWVTPAINPFLVACAEVAVVLLIKPALAAIYYPVAYASFFTFVSWTQRDQELLLSIRVNGITAVGIGLCLALMQWHNTVVNCGREG